MNKAVVNYMMEQMGGEDEVRAAFYLEQVKKLTRENYTVAGIRDIAKRDKWIEVLDGFTFQEIADQFHSRGGKTAGKTKNGSRLTPAETEQIRAGVLQYLRRNSRASKSEIAEAIGFPGNKLGPQLRVLKDAGQIQQHGAKAGACYSLKK